MLGILAVVVAASGCTDNTTTNKTYSNNGISFTYPGDWSEQNATESSTLAVVGNDTSGFALASTTITNVATTNQWASNFKALMKSDGYTFVSGKPRTVDGQSGYEVVMQKSGKYTSTTFFVKNSNPYIAAFTFPTNDQQTVDMILNSLKVP